MEEPNGNSLVENLNNLFRRISLIRREEEEYQKKFELDDVKVDKLSKDQLKDYKEAFAHYDKEREGIIRPKDLRYVMRSLGQNPTEHELEDVRNKVKIEGSGYIEFHEFVTIMSKKCNDSNEEYVQEAFRVFDTAETGSISADEIFSVMCTLDEGLTLDEIESIIKEIDSNGDGLIEYEVFFEIMSSN